MFERVFGHQRVKHILAKMIAAGQLPHGMCFHGPNGIGKQLMAFEVARAMLCETRTGCGTCNSCKKLDSGNHPDFLLIAPDGQDIKVDQIREVGENLHFRPYESEFRIVVLDQVDRMRESAANAFLKSLEEPPEYVFFILVCADLKALLPTIRSRCQKIGFQSLNTEDKAQILMARFGKDEATAKRLARVSFDQLETDEAALERFERDLQTILKFFQMMLAEGHALDAFADIARDKSMFPKFKTHLLAVVRELIRRAYDAPSETLFEPVADAMHNLAKQASPQAWREVLENLLWLEGQRRRNLNQGLWFNALSVNALGLDQRQPAQPSRR